MKKIILSSILFSTLVFSEQIRIIPIDKSLLAHENGGNKPAIDAYSDGVGIITESKQIIDNSPMNQLVFTYGEKAKNNASSLKNFSIENGTNEEKALANKLGQVGELNNDIEGTACNDNNVQTINDKYVNSICVGTNVEGQSCDDGFLYTNNDIYTNGICSGTVLTGTSCDDNNPQTINDKYNSSGICLGTNVEGRTCNDNNVQTINDKYVNGICIGTNVEGTPCNDNIDYTENDKYTNGICLGTEISFNTNYSLIQSNFSSNNLNWNILSGISFQSRNDYYFAYKFFNLPSSGIYKFQIFMNKYMKFGIGSPYSNTWSANSYIGNSYWNGAGIYGLSSMGRVSWEYGEGIHNTYNFYIDTTNKKFQITDLNMKLLDSGTYSSNITDYFFIADRNTGSTGTVTFNYTKKH